MLSGLGFANHGDGIGIALSLSCSLCYQVSKSDPSLEIDTAFLGNRNYPQLLDCHGRPSDVFAAAFKIEITPHQFRVL